MSTNAGGGGRTSNAPHVPGKDGGVVYKQNPSHNTKEFKEFHDEAVVRLSSNPDALANISLNSAAGNKAKSLFNNDAKARRDTASTKDTENNSSINAFHNSSLIDIAKALTNQKNSADTEAGAKNSASSDALDRHFNTFPELAFNTNANANNASDTVTPTIWPLSSKQNSSTDNSSASKQTKETDVTADRSDTPGSRQLKGTANTTDTEKSSKTGLNSRLLADNTIPSGQTGQNQIFRAGVTADTMTGSPRASDLMYRDGVPGKPDVVSQLSVNTPQTGPLNVDFNGLRYNNGEFVRNAQGNPLALSIDINKPGIGSNRIDFIDRTLVNTSGIAQQGLFFNEQATKLSSNALIMDRQDGAHLSYQPYLAANGSAQVRMTALSSYDGTRGYLYDNPNNPGLATRIIDSTHDINGTPLLQMRVREGNTNTFQMYEYQMQYGQPTLVRTERELNVQTRADGQFIYQRDWNPVDLQQRARQGEFNNYADRDKISGALGKDTTWLAGNDLRSSKRALLNASKGRLFGGDDAKTSRYIDMYITRIHDWAKKGYTTANDDQLAASLRRVADIFTTKRTGAAGQISDDMVNYHVTRALMCLGSPGLYNNQGQVGTCYVNSYRMAAEYIYPHLVLDKFASILTTGEAKGRKFTKTELSRKRYLGEDSFNYIMNNLCAKFRYGSKYSLRSSFPGTAEFQAQREYRMLTDGGKLPLGSKAHKKYGVKMAYTMGGGHAQCWVGNLLENTWDGYSQTKTPTPRVEELLC